MYASAAAVFAWCQPCKADELAVVVGVLKALGKHYQHGRGTFAYTFYTA